MRCSEQTGADERGRFEGALLGLALGDAFGAPYEGGPLERLLWRRIGRTRAGSRRWTDDTQMALGLAESLIERGRVDQEHLARRFANDYTWSRGYGPGAARALKRVRRGVDWRVANRAAHRDGSYGNGGAMRAPVVGLYLADRPGDLVHAARASAEVTHSHPLGMEGAVLIAVATAAALRGARGRALLDAGLRACALEPYVRRLHRAAEWVESGGTPSPRDVRRELGNGRAAADSCVTALYAAARCLDAEFHELLDFLRAVGGDVDTLSAMAGAVWGAARGVAALPASSLRSLEDGERIRATARRLHAAARA